MYIVRKNILPNMFSYCQVIAQFLFWDGNSVSRQKRPGKPAKHFVPRSNPIVPTMNLKYFHKSELLHSLLVVIGTWFPQQQGYPLYMYCNKEYFCQISTLNSFMLRYCTIPLLPWQQRFHGNQVSQQCIFPQGTIVPNMNIKYSHGAEFLHSFLVAMRTVFQWQQGYLLTYIAIKDICAKYELKIFLFC